MIKQQTSKGWTFLFAIMALGALYILAITSMAAASFARNGGEANILSPNSDTTITGDSNGNIVTVIGDDNNVSGGEPQAVPEAQPSRNGAWFINGVLTAVFGFGLIFLVWIRKEFWQGKLAKEQ